MTDFYIVSLKHTNREHEYITVWRPDDKGYAWPLSWAGKYSEADVLAGRDYYHRGDDTLAVPCILLDSLAVPPTKGTVDNDAGPVVLNNWTNWKCILEFAMPDPMYTPKPKCKGARRRATKEALHAPHQNCRPAELPQADARGATERYVT